MQASGDVPEGDNVTAVGHACNRLDKAISTSDPAKVRPAAAALRPILARLGLPPASPREQLAALEEETSGASGETLFYVLADFGKRAFNSGKADKTKIYSKKLLQMASRYRRDWN
jgi:hypothetical protein